MESDLGSRVPAGAKSDNTVRQTPLVTPEQRARALAWRGGTVWITGLPAAGKSTVAAAVEQALVLTGRPAYRLDGDNLRHGLNGDLGFGQADRAENVRRAAHAAALMADAGVLVMVSLISPYAADRDAARQVHTDQALPFAEVFVDTPLATCEQRDPKGLYARARSGELSGVTGVDDPYERPVGPELVLEPAPLDRQVAQVLELIRGWDARG